jgi:hypothetical protein
MFPNYKLETISLNYTLKKGVLSLNLLKYNSKKATLAVKNINYIKNEKYSINKYSRRFMSKNGSVCRL